jgi:hypothetical protein
MKKHLQSKHGIVIETTSGRVQTKTLQQLQQLYLKAKSSDQTEEIDTQVFEQYLDQDMIYEALVSLIVVGNLSFRMVEQSEFHTFCQLLNPKANTVIPTTHSIIGRKSIKPFKLIKTRSERNSNQHCLVFTFLWIFGLHQINTSCSG